FSTWSLVPKKRSFRMLAAASVIAFCANGWFANVDCASRPSMCACSASATTVVASRPTPSFVSMLADASSCRRQYMLVSESVPPAPFAATATFGSSARVFGSGSARDSPSIGRFQYRCARMSSTRWSSSCFSSARTCGRPKLSLNSLNACLKLSSDSARYDSADSGRSLYCTLNSYVASSSSRRTCSRVAARLAVMDRSSARISVSRSRGMPVLMGGDGPARVPPCPDVSASLPKYCG
ncbi:hypothetical protein KEM52_003586, partial [Ascosphaera acerosa]